MSKEYSETELEAVQAVVDRVSSYQDGAPEETVRDELAIGFGDAGVALDDADLDKLSSAIEAEHGAVVAGDVLRGGTGS